MEVNLMSAAMQEPTQEAKYRNKMLRMAQIRTGAVVLALVLLVVVAGSVLQWSGQIGAILTDAQTSVQNLNDITQELQQANITGLLDGVSVLMEDVGVLVEDAQVAVGDAVDGMGQAVGKIDALDIAKLNEAIADLSAVVEPLARLFGGKR